MTKISALKKLASEQIIYVPLETASFMKWINALEQRPESFEEKMTRDYHFAVVCNFIYWLPVSFTNFYLIPIQYRAIYIACTTLVIDTFTSFASHNNLKEAFENLGKMLKP